MNIALESSELLSPRPTGIGNYVLYLTQEFSKVSGDKFQFSSCFKLSRLGKRKYAPRFKNISCSWHTSNLIFDFKKYDIAHSPSGILLKSGCAKRILTIHDVADLLPEHKQIHDYSVTDTEKSFSHLKNMIAQSDAVICVSESTRNDVDRLFSLKNKLTEVTHLAPCLPLRQDTNNTEALTSFGLKEKSYLLFTGSLSVRKNIPSLIEAFNLSGLHKDYILVLAGEKGMGFEKIQSLIEKYNLAGNILLTGYVNQGELISLYKNAKAFVFPTYYEGFGMTVLEAMQFGCPVLIGNRGAAPEIAGGFAVEVNPFSIDDIKRGLLEVVSAGNETINLAQKHAASFTWNKTAKQTLQVYEKALGY